MLMQISQDQSTQPEVPWPSAQSPQAKTQGNARVPGRPAPIKTIAAIILIVAIIAVVAVVFVFGRGGSATTTTTTVIGSNTTTIKAVVASLTGCSNITSPGTYTLGSKIKTGIARGACINIAASNVKLSCGGNRIVGSGPFDALPPFSYGIQIEASSNVSVSDCAISNFSYGIGAFSSSKLMISGSNVSSNYMANIYLNHTVNSTIENNFLAKSLSWQGSLFLANRSISNLIKNNTVAFNQVYGINVSSDDETFIDNIVNITSQFGFYCSASNSYPGSSLATGNNCFDNNGCAFLKCSGENLPANLSKIVVSNGVFSCGSINHPGSYALEQDINMGSYLNVSNPSASNQNEPCISIRANDVKLNCNGHQIYNSTYAVGFYNSRGSILENCRINGASGYGVVMFSSSNSTVSNTTVKLSGSSLGGLLIQNSDSANVTNSSFTGGQYGITINNSQSNNLLGVNSSKNSYGLYLLGSSIGNNFYNVKSANNSRIDVYAGPTLVSSQVEFVSSMRCGNTNAHWAPCPVFVVANLGYTPVTACITADSPGTYTMQSDIINGRDNCIAITSSNVVFNCAGKSVETSQITSGGFAVTVNGAGNVQIENCMLRDFAGGISASRSSGLSITNVSIINSPLAIILSNMSGAVVTGDSVNTSTGYGIRLTNVTGSKITHNNLMYGPSYAVGISLNNSRLNSIINNTVSHYHDAYSFAGVSNNNTVTNNIALLSGDLDYLCSGNSNSNLGAEYGGINYGSTKSGCYWMALIQKIGDVVSATPPCLSTSSPTSVSLTSDYIYPYGSVCFTVNNNATTINCNGHTIIATKGGVFADLAAGAGSVVENCQLEGFTTPIEAEGGSGNIYNNTILQTNSNETAIMVSGFQGGTVQANNLTGGLYSVAAYNTVSAHIKNNFAFHSATAFYVYNASGTQISGDFAAASTGNGLVLNDTQLAQVQGMTLNSGIMGLSCLGSSANTKLISDQGGNSCSSVGSSCKWLTLSSSSC